MKKLMILLLVTVILLFSGCGKSSKIGLYEFNNRLNKISGTNFLAEEYMINKTSDEKGFFSLNIIDGIISLFMREDNTINGVSLLFTNENECDSSIRLFRNLCCVLTGNDENQMNSIFKDCEITSSNLSFENNNLVMTVENYKYTVICNKYSITLFCERI